MKASELNANWRLQGLPYQIEQYGSAPVWAICRLKPYDDNAITVLYGNEEGAVSEARMWLKQLKKGKSAPVIQFKPNDSKTKDE
ncbi:MAG: hypothetical protein GY807_05700 [Gammaproteobacteria bacterium]|nr:hypothetical protein [Gammaproteobacteria bacterium]